jgi:SAM-dependent methyltransferase
LGTIRNWDERYRQQENLDWRPMPLLVRAAASAAPGHALDLACGAGRHALYLAQLGWEVTAVDGSEVAIGIVRQRAGAARLALDARLADLEHGGFSLEPDRYDLVCDFFYLERSLFPRIRAGVRPGGLFVATIHMFDDTPDLRPRNPAFLLHPGELAAAFAGWELVHAAERKEDERRRKVAELIARRPK